MEQGTLSANVVPLDHHTRGSPWESVLWRLHGRTGALVAFTLCHALLVCLGYSLKEQASDSALLWPSMGLLLTALWISDRSFWIPLLLVHAVVELAVGAWLQQPFVLRMAVFYVSANALAAVVGALLAHWLIDDVAQVRTLQVLQLMFAMAVGALAGALPGAWVNMLVYGAEPGYLHQLQMWWVANWLGALSTGTVVFCWLIPIRLDFPQLALRSRVELAVLAALLVMATLYVFQANPQQAGSLLQLPVVIVALLAWAACRLPPRWAATLAMMTTLFAAWLAVHRQGPFIATDPLVRALQVQTFLAACSAVAFVISTSLAEKSIALGRLRESETRYRHFVEVSNEAVWRVELEVPMPVALPGAMQVEWLRRHARVVECNRPFQHMEASVDPAMADRWDGARPWCAAYEQHLGAAATQGFSVDDLRFSVHRQGRPCVYLTSYCGVVHEGRLQRIWGVARDITELVDLNARLLRDQDRLKSYARQIVTAEEKARRATAVDLHDGIGQSLVGMAMTLEVAREHAPPEVRLLVDEVRGRLREVQERTRHMISDLSPPGLYDLGLAPALQWLAVYMRGHDQLHVELDARLREESVKLEMRVLVFKLVRELLRNVVKHAGVGAAAVRVAGDAQSLRVEVSDQGKGFEWQMDMFGGRSGGFGLWSIADRVHEAGGQFKVDTAPGRGSRFELVFPLRATGFTGEQPGLRVGRPV